MRKANRESFIKILLGKIPKLGMLIRQPRKKAVLICVSGRCKTDWKEAKHQSNMEDINERL